MPATPPTCYSIASVRSLRARAPRAALVPRHQRTRGTTQSVQTTGGFRLAGARPLALSQSTASLIHIGSDLCAMNRCDTDTPHVDLPARPD